MDCRAAALEKISNAIRHIEEVNSRHFPHDGSEKALSQLRESLSMQRELLTAAQYSSDEVARSAAMDANIELSDILQSLGLVVNSSNTSTPLEIHGPLSEVVRKLLDQEYELIFSFTWDYSPFLFLPDTLKDNFVIISMPASEAENALIIPAAAHEVGHSAFDIYRGSLILKIGAAVQSTLKDKGVEIQSDVQNLAEYQCEEIFADAVGVVLFGESYFNAMTYLLSPRVTRYRSPVYPSLRSRISYMYRSAAKVGIVVKEGFENFFDTEECRADQSDHISLSDVIVEQVVDEFIETAIRHCKSRDVHPPTGTDTGIAMAFMDGRPASGVKHLGDVLNAGWRVYNDEAFSCGRDKLSYVSELVLKTFEIMEIEQKTGGLP